MIAISKNIYFDDIVNKYNNTVNRTIKMKPIEVTNYFYAEYNEHSNNKDSKFKIDDKNIFATGYIRNWSEEVFLLIKLKI